MKKFLSSLVLGVSLLAPVAGIALARPDEHACDGRGGVLNPSNKGVIHAEEVGGNVHCDFSDPNPET